jgi:hypothetical protein
VTGSRQAASAELVASWFGMVWLCWLGIVTRQDRLLTFAHSHFGSHASAIKKVAHGACKDCDKAGSSLVAVFQFAQTGSDEHVSDWEGASPMVASE